MCKYLPTYEFVLIGLYNNIYYYKYTDGKRHSETINYTNYPNSF